MGISPLSIYKKQRYKKNKGNTKFNAFFNGKVIFEAILRFKTLENGKKMKQKCQNKYPQMQF